MSELIDRQAAIDAFLTELTKRERKNLLHTWSTVEVKYFITKMLEQMPSAQQKPLKYTGESICLYCQTVNCDGCMYEPVMGVQ